MLKKVLAYVIALVMVVSYFIGSVSAKSEDYMTLPVQLYDYDADGLFYEYALYKGMDTFGLGESNNEGMTQGLVASKLGDDGLPVYTKSAVENAAKTIQENLVSGKNDESLTRYSIFNTFATYKQAQGSTYTKDDVLGNEQNYFYDRWNLENIQASKTNGILHSGVGTVWQQDTDGVVNYGVKDHLKKTIDVEANAEYKFDCWRDGGEHALKYQIKDSNGNVLDDNGSNTTFTATTSKVILDIYKDDDYQGRLKFSIPKLTKEGVTSKNYLGDNREGSNFIKEGWTSEKYQDNSYIDKDNGEIIHGDNYWKQDGDGVVCLKDSSIVLNTDIPTDQNIKLTYYLGYGYNADGMTIDLLDSNNKVLVEKLKLEDKEGGEYTLTTFVPQGTGTVKVRINGKENSRIAAMTITPLGQVLPLGDYNDTVLKYKNNQLKTVEDCSSCMDYAYLRLKNFYNTDFYLNKKSNKYNQMVLRKIVEDNTNKYYFDSSKTTTYDETNKSFYNNEDEGISTGFFPLDYMDGEKMSDQNGDDAQDHNYHFAMKVDGDFIYKKGSNQFFDFTGDDDVYVFINGQLAVDLGGAHKELSTSLDIEKYASENGIKNGEKCHFQMFYLERHTTTSNCKIQINLKIGNHVEYKFESGTECKTPPQDILDLVPVDENEYFEGDVVQIADQNKTFENYVDLENKGVWKFVGWDKENQVMTTEDIQFVGTWIFIPDNFKVKYEFVSGTKGKELPQEILDMLPNDLEHLTRNQIIEVENNFKKEIKVKDGVWKFKSWDKDSVTIEDKDEFFKGVWEFTANEEPTQNVQKPENNQKGNTNKTKNITKQTKTSKVKTGDDTALFMYSLMLLVALLGFMLVLRKKVR